MGFSSADCGAQVLHRKEVPLLPWKPDGRPVDLELVNSLREQAWRHSGEL